MANQEITNRQIQPAVANILAGVKWGQKFIAPRCLPSVDVGAEDFSYETYDNSGLEDVTAAEASRSLGADTKESVLPEGSTVSDTLKEYARRVAIDYRQIQAARNADRLRPLVGGMSREERLLLRMGKRLQHNLQILKEKDAATIFFTAANYDSGLKNESQVDFSATGIVDEFMTQKRAVAKKYGVAPDTLILGFESFRLLLKNADFLDRVKGGATNGQPAEVNEQLIAQILGIQQVLVGTAVTQAYASTGAGTATDLWTEDKAALVYLGVNSLDETGQPTFDDADESSPAFAKLFTMNVPDTGVQFDVRTYWSLNGKIYWEEVTEFWKAKKVMAAGYYWNSTDNA
jgi:hypothetical protein